MTRFYARNRTLDPSQSYVGRRMPNSDLTNANARYCNFSDTSMANTEFHGSTLNKAYLYDKHADSEWDKEPVKAIA